MVKESWWVKGVGREAGLGGLLVGERMWLEIY